MLDLAKGYWQVPMEEADKEKTAFTSPLELRQFTVMPFWSKWSSSNLSTIDKPSAHGDKAILRSLLGQHNHLQRNMRIANRQCSTDFEQIEECWTDHQAKEM